MRYLGLYSFILLGDQITPSGGISSCFLSLSAITTVVFECFFAFSYDKILRILVYIPCLCSNGVTLLAERADFWEEISVLGGNVTHRTEMSLSRVDLRMGQAMPDGLRAQAGPAKNPQPCDFGRELWVTGSWLTLDTEANHTSNQSCLSNEIPIKTLHTEAWVSFPADDIAMHIVTP